MKRGSRKSFILVISLILSAWLLAEGIRAPQYSFFTWLGLLPLFLSIKRFPCFRSLFCGALWGISIYFFYSGHNSLGSKADIQALIVLTLTPAVYAFLGSLLCRRIGFNALIMALGWVGVEAVLQALNWQQGFLTGVLGGGILIRLVSGILGYLFIAFIIVLITAALFSVASNIHVRVVRICLRLVIPQIISGYLKHIIPVFSVSSFVELIGPRAPPVVK